MLRRIPRLLRRAVIVAVLLAVSASVYQSWATGTAGHGRLDTDPVRPTRPRRPDLLVEVRLAGLWEGPTGQQAEQQASSAEVREVGRKLADEHAQLDAEVRRVADQLGVAAAERAHRPAARLDGRDLGADGVGLRPHVRAAGARGARRRAAGDLRGARQHPERAGPRVRRHLRRVRHPPPRVPGEHRPRRLLGAAAPRAGPVRRRHRDERPARAVPRVRRRAARRGRPLLGAAQPPRPAAASASRCRAPPAPAAGPAETPPGAHRRGRDSRATRHQPRGRAPVPSR